MPAYDFENTKTGEQLRIHCKSEDKRQVLSEEVDIPDDWKQVFKLNMSMAGGKTTMVSRTSEGFRDRLRAIKKANPRSTIDV